MQFHVLCPDGEAVFWLEPCVASAKQYGLKPKALNEIAKVIPNMSWEQEVQYFKKGAVAPAMRSLLIMA